MTVDSLGWNGAAFTWMDREEADVACAGPLITSDVCQGLKHKIRASEIYDVLIAVAMIVLVSFITFNSWLVHQLRFGLVEQTQEKAVVGYYGCVTANAAWWLDPCTYIVAMAVSIVPSLCVGLPAYPIAIALARDNFVGLGGLWWGGAQTIFGVQAVLVMYAGYELYCIAVVLQCIMVLSTMQQRDKYRALVYGGGIDSSEDATKFVEALGEGVSNRVRSMTGVLNYVPNLQWSAPGTSALDASIARQEQQQAQRGEGNREYSKSTLDQMIPTEEEFGGGGSPFGEINYEGSKQGAVIPGAAAQAEQEVDANAFAPTKSFST